MDKAELKTITIASAAVSEALKICQAGETAIKGHLGMKSDEGIAIALRDLQAATTGELSVHFKAYINLVSKAAAIVFHLNNCTDFSPNQGSSLPEGSVDFAI